ncbi:unnamed protein product [Aureobasidium uvarum]|uniref:Vacuolar protein sorting-associated protein 8 central domain-containing protein n=1 Tax=Aureobasidium uvarum TaxID=2773716 RepID=A0A9N8KBS0_9PEZI|nr:unnamed protein product [Aureobasidium uvarum]
MSSPPGHAHLHGHDQDGTFPFPQHQDAEDSFLTAHETVSHPGSPVPFPDQPVQSLEDELSAQDIADVDDVADLGPQTPDLASPSESASIPDDTPSVQGSVASSLPVRRPRLNPRASTNSPRTPSGALQPFERRFSSRFTSPSPSSRAASPAFLTPHSRQSSLSSQIVLSQGGSDIADAPDAPWEVVRWTRLRKITSQAFSEAGRRNFGTLVCLAVSSSISVGTSKGLILVFDYHQTLKGIIGQGTKAIECGAITALAISADYSAIAAGHATGHIFTWELARPAKPFLHIPPTPRDDQSHSPDGHVPGRSVLHIGFLGTRRTALVSADDGGMAFSHLASRGMGAISRSVKTTRLLGRYPAPNLQEEIRIKPSSVLAFAPLPLGNVEQATDAMGLTALLTPYLLVIVSTTPVAQTQHKASRPKSISRHSAMSGCLAWFPAVKLKSSNSTSERDTSETKLVYCWSNVLTVLDVDVQVSQDPADKEKPPNLFFHQRSSWECEEAIVAVQWLSRSVIGVLTISQQLIIIEDGELHVMDSVDLLHRQIHHRDIFSKQLHPVVEQADNEHSEMHGVIADAFYQSFRVYKNRLFLLGASDLSVGTLSNWADRLTALIEHGDYIAAIQLARAYYTGQAGGVTVGLPDNADARHELVNGRLLELMSASILFSFSENNNSGRPLSDLVAECFDACVSMDNQSFLFDDIYEPLRDAGQREVFLEILQSYIMDEEVTALPPPLVKDLVESCTAKNQVAHLEELLCRLDPRMFDLDQITTLCKTHYLYDALTFVWNEALNEYVTPLTDFLALLRDVKDVRDQTEEAALESVVKVFPYLAFILTGRKYPQGDFLDDEKADTQKGNIYRYLFSHEPTPWPPGSSFILRTRQNPSDEPAFPYLRLLLEYDSASFMSMMTEAFEDPYLNDSQEDDTTSVQPKTNGNGLKITRQYIVSVLLDIMSSGDFIPEQTIYLDMFIARNLPKYPQFMVLSSSSLHQVLDRLCSFREDGLADDCQLSAEYLLSVYHPPITTALIEKLRDAQFYRVLKTLYRTEHRPVDLLNTYFEDPQGKNGIFDDLAYALQESHGKQTSQLKDVLCEHAQELASINTSKTAHALARYTDDILERFVDAVEESYTRFHFLRTLLEPSLLDQRSRKIASEPVSEALVSRFCEQYVELMCVHDPRHVSDYVGLLKSGDLDLDRVLPSLEENGVVDAAVLLMAQDGLARDAIDRLCKHLRTLQNAICSLIQAASEAPDVQSTEEATDDLLEAIEKYTRLGIWLCNGQSAAMHQPRQPRQRTNIAWDIKETDLELDELLWLNLIDAIVLVSKSVFAETNDLVDDSSFDIDRTNNALRGTVQQTFTALLSATSTTFRKPEDDEDRQTTRRSQHNQSFLYIFRAFLSRVSSSYAPTLSDLRAVLLDVFAAYAHESSVLNLASSMLDVDVFADMDSIHSLRNRGWRPRTQICELCKKRAWGTGVGVVEHDHEAIWEEFERLEEQRLENKAQKAKPLDNGKGKSVQVGGGVAERTKDREEVVKKQTLVVFACRHTMHRVCLEVEMAGVVSAGEEESSGYFCPVCHEE